MNIWSNQGYADLPSQGASSLLAYKRLIIEKKKLEHVLNIEARLHNISDLNKLIDFVINKTCEVLETQKCSIMFVDETSGDLCVRGHCGIEEARIGVAGLRIGGQIEDLIELHRSRGIRHPCDRSHGSLKIDGTAYHSDNFLSVPIKIGEHLLGIINVSDKKRPHDPAFSDLDLKILSLIARQTRAAIENAKLHQNLKYLTVTDALTGAHNYRYFIQTLDYELMRSRRYQRHLALLLLDLDHFKNYNEIFGFLEGDRALKSVAAAMKDNLRLTDETCRFGPDEFAVTLPETDLDKAKIAGEKIQRKIAELSLMRPMTACIGAVQCGFHADRHSLLHKLSNALYSAKSQGKNQIFG